MASERRAVAAVLLLAAVSMADVPPRRPPPVDRCDTDADCVVLGPPCCPTCCPQPPQAASRAEAERVRERCARIECGPPDCSQTVCAAIAMAPVRAACRAARCVTVPIAEAADCRQDRDCAVATVAAPPGASCHQSPCGCCPGYTAVPVQRAEPPVAQPAPKPAPQPGKPPFGLTTGGAPPPQCSPCPSAPSAAVCRTGRCELVTAVPLRR